MSYLLTLAPLIVAPFIGSFVTALAARVPVDKNVVFAHSRCPECDHALAPYELIPILSWLVLRGRCAHCRAAIPAFYPLVELTAVLIALWSVVTVEGWHVWVSCGLVWTLLTIVLIDWRHFIVPDVLSLPLLLAGLAVAAWLDMTRLGEHAFAAVIGYAAIRLIDFVYGRLRGRTGIGQGDAKLLAAAGAWVSWQGLPSVVLWACASALAAILVQRIAGTRIAGDTKVPFGSHLALGLWLVWLYGPISAA